MPRPRAAYPAQVSDFVIGLASWVLQDGGYDDFTTGSTERFAVEMAYTDNLGPTHDTARLRCDSVDGFRYDVVGEVVADAEGTVVDIGRIRVFTGFQLEHLPHRRVGDRLTGQITLFVDSGVTRLERMPPLTYTWTIDKIELNVTTRVWLRPGDPGYPKTVRPGPLIGVVADDAQQWRVINRTRMWKDEEDSIAGGYRLHCTLLPDPPTQRI